MPGAQRLLHGAEAAAEFPVVKPGSSKPGSGLGVKHPIGTDDENEAPIGGRELDGRLEKPA